MNDKEIENLIDELRNQKNYDEAYIGYFQYGGGPDESFIKANRQGLELHAAELLEAALGYNLSEGKMKTFTLDEGIQDENSDIYFSYIELLKEKRNSIIPESEYVENLKDKAIKFGCLGLGILLIVLVIIGLTTAISWI